MDENQNLEKKLAEEILKKIKNYINTKSIIEIIEEYKIYLNDYTKKHRLNQEQKTKITKYICDLIYIDHRSGEYLSERIKKHMKID